MVFSTERSGVLLPILILVIVSCPYFSEGFVPTTKRDDYQQVEHSWTSLCHDALEQRRSYTVPVRETATRLHAFTDVLAGFAVVTAGFAGWLYIDGADSRQRNKMRAEEAERIKAIQEERARLAYIEPKEYWTEEELAPYDGSKDEDGPILLAADGLVFNVYKGRNFYLPGE